MNIDLPLVWAVILLIAVFMYVVMDGFDLGIGILFPFFRKGEDRDSMMSSIAPIWDGNETWLVLGGVGLMPVFPLAFSVLFTAFYAPLIAMLLALIFRGVAFEFRYRDPGHRRYWDAGFVLGSLVATFMQGMVLGTFIQGISVANRVYAGGWFDWLTPFSLFTGAALVAGYGLLGAGWLVLKTEGELRDRAYRMLPWLLVLVLAAIVVASLWTPLLNEEIARRWFSLPNLIYLSPVPILVAATGFLAWRAIGRRRDRQPFLYGLALFALSFVGLGISLYPYIVPPHITIWDAVAPESSQIFMLVGTLLLLPLILGYTFYAYWVFRGKVRSGEGYH